MSESCFNSSDAYEIIFKFFFKAFITNLLSFFLGESCNNVALYFKTKLNNPSSFLKFSGIIENNSGFLLNVNRIISLLTVGLFK